ncbi:glycosyltransferase family 2 protein [Candidatus Hydrogenedentota bacterium]
MMNCPEVDVVIPFRGALPSLQRCLESVTQSTYPAKRVIAVDDATPGGDLAELKRDFPDVEFIHNEENLGPSMSKNKGIEAGGGRYVATLDSDVRVSPDWLKPLVSAMENDETIGACCAKLRLDHQDRDILASCGIEVTRAGGPVDLGAFSLDVGQHDATRRVMAGCSAGAIYRRTALEVIEAFDSAFFYPEEDVEIGVRLNLAGFKFLYVPESIVIHELSRTMGLENYKKTFHIEKNRIRGLLKNFPFTFLVRLSPALVARYVRHMEIALKRLLGPGRSLGERPRYAAAIGKAVLWNLLHLAGTLSERRRIRGLRQITDKEFDELLLPSVPSSHNIPDYRPIDSETPLSIPENESVSVGKNDVNYLGYGWHVPVKVRLKEDGVIRVRPMGAEGDLYLPAGGFRKLKLTFMGLAEESTLAIHRNGEGPVELRLLRHSIAEHYITLEGVSEKILLTVSASEAMSAGLIGIRWLQ